METNPITNKTETEKFCSLCCQPILHGELNLDDSEAKKATNLTIHVRCIMKAICLHEWREGPNITIDWHTIQDPGGKTVTKKEILPIMVCEKCFVVRLKTPEEMKELQKKLASSILVPGQR